MTINKQKRISQKARTRNALEGSAALVRVQETRVIMNESRRRLGPEVTAPKQSGFSIETKRGVATPVILPEAGRATGPIENEDPTPLLKVMFKARMEKAYGSRDQDFISDLFEQSANALPGGMGADCKNANYSVAALHGISPRDELEALLAVQMVSVHTLSMEFLKRAAISEQTDLGIEVNVNRANKLLRAFANQVEALSRYRGKGEQKMIVEHVHVYQGGQAIVGPVNQRTDENRSKHEKVK